MRGMSVGNWFTWTSQDVTDLEKDPWFSSSACNITNAHLKYHKIKSLTTTWTSCRCCRRHRFSTNSEIPFEDILRVRKSAFLILWAFYHVTTPRRSPFELPTSFISSALPRLSPINCQVSALTISRLLNDLPARIKPRDKTPVQKDSSETSRLWLFIKISTFQFWNRPMEPIRSGPVWCFRG